MCLFPIFSAVGAQSLAKPDGSFGVGYWRTTVARDDREPRVLQRSSVLLLELWYPGSMPVDRRRPKAYASPRLDSALSAQFGFPSGWSAAVATHAFADLTPSEGRRPIVVFSHGLSFPILLYQSIAEDLASRGYIVVGINHGGGATIEYSPTAPLGTMSMPTSNNEEERQLMLAGLAVTWAGDVRRVLDYLPRLESASVSSPLAGRLDLSRIALLGHSLGGSAVARLTNDPRVKRVAVMEGKLRDSTAKEITVSAPFMHIIGEYNRLELENRNYRPSSAAPVYQVVIAGTGHASFSDLVHVYKQTAPAEWLERHRYELEPPRILQITRDYLSAFFGRYLNGVDNSLLHPTSYAARVDGPRTAGYAEVTMTIDVR